MLLSDIMACGFQCYQRQYRRQGTKLDRYWGITKHRKERSLRGRMLLVTLQHDLTSTLDSGVQTDMIVLEFSKAFDRVPNIQFTRCNRPEFPPSQFFPRGKNGPAHSFPGEKIGRPILSPPSQFPPPPTNNFKNHNGIIISLYKFKKPLLN